MRKGTGSVGLKWFRGSLELLFTTTSWIFLTLWSHRVKIYLNLFFWNVLKMEETHFCQLEIGVFSFSMKMTQREGGNTHVACVWNELLNWNVRDVILCFFHFCFFRPMKNVSTWSTLLNQTWLSQLWLMKKLAGGSKDSRFASHSYRSNLGKVCCFLICVYGPSLFRVRTSSGTFLGRGHDEIVETIEKRISDFTFIPVGTYPFLL